MTSTRDNSAAANPAVKRALDKQASDAHFAKVAADVAAAAQSGSAVVMAAPSAAGNTAGALASLKRGGA